MAALGHIPDWRLAPEVHATAVDDDLVFLDIRRDAYMCLPDGGRWSTGARTLAPPADLAEALQAAGLITPAGDEEIESVAAWVSPTQCAILDVYPPPRWRDAGKLAWAAHRASTRYRRVRFAELIAWARQTRVQPPAPSAALLAAVRDFQRWIPYAPVSGKCLLRSFLLLEHLRAEGLDALWIFGVRLWPFTAHCWLQAGEVALDEQPDRIRSFTPILVL